MSSQSSYALLAEFFRYPAAGRLELLERALAERNSKPAPHKLPHCAAFIQDIQRLSLSEWEELYTSTWDLNPTAAPYIGYQTWGENYQRGKFMAALNRALFENNVDSDGELPDHLIPALRYLAVASPPLPELIEILPAALERMIAALRKADRNNPYLHLLEEAQQSIPLKAKG